MDFAIAREDGRKRPKAQPIPPVPVPKPRVESAPGRPKARTAPAALICERYGTDVAPVVALAAMGRAAVAEEAGRVGVGAVTEVLDPR